ncbi:MAG: c-type cytochrome [Stagnimonas sp.]|nr:c-type cytochrome [Stagnimonas sp.]
MRLAAPLAAAFIVLAGSAQGADASRGEQLYSRCAACHALAADRVGPRHCGLLGRRAGSVPGFFYTDEMKSSKLVWDEKTLDRFLAKPMAVVPGTSMTYDGVPTAQDRADLIAYLRKAGSAPECQRP